MSRTNQARWGGAGFFVAGVLLAAHACADSDFPALTVEISPDHPLFVFTVRDPAGGDTTRYMERITEAWTSLPETLRPYAVVEIDAPGSEVLSRHERYLTILAALQGAAVPTVITVADGNPRRYYPVTHLAELLHDFTCIKGISVSGMRLNEYDPLDAAQGMEPPRLVRWLSDAVLTAARYGRFAWISLDELGWLRVMSNTACAPLYAALRDCRGYVVPGLAYRGPHVTTELPALMGFWLEGAADYWGVAPDSRWYADACFDGPGRFGGAGNAEKMPSPLYRAMMLNGAMTGATVYAFPEERDLWFGPARHHWDTAIRPALEELLDKGLIARQDFVREKARLVYQLAPAANALEFHGNLRDLDGVCDLGLMAHAAYGMERPGQVPELILNHGERYWIPVVSAHAPTNALSGFAKVVHPGEVPTAEAWVEFLTPYSAADGEGTAFICRVGRGLYLMNTRENAAEMQTARVAEAPAPVRGLVARREGDGITLTWPFREGDVSYKVYKRVLPELRYTLLANGLDQRRFADPGVPEDATVAYAVTALTNEKEPFETTLNYGEYLALSVVESRIAEEVVVTPVLSYCEARPVAPEAPVPAPSAPWWPAYEGLDETQRRMAMAIVERIEAWDRAASAQDLNGILDIYSTEYEDPQGWRFQYVRRAYQWLFERYSATRMHRQIRAWDFSPYAANRTARVLLYARLTGYALTDASGRVADVPMSLPAPEAADIWITWTDQEGVWRILHTDPALPNFKELLGYSAGPFDGFRPGPDLAAPEP